MDLPLPHGALAALASFVRQRLAEANEVLAPLWTARAVAGSLVRADGQASVRHSATVIVGAAAPFAPTPQARARLLRQMHACGLLSPGEASRTAQLLQAAETVGVPR